MASGRLEIRHAGLVKQAPQIGDLPYPVLQVRFVQDFLQSLGHRLEVPSGQAAVRRESLPDNKRVLDPGGQVRVVEGDESADIDQGVLLGAHRRPVGVGKHLPGDVPDRPASVALLPALDEPGVFGEPAGVEEERDFPEAADGRDLPDVGQRDRLAAPAVVGHGHHHDGHAAGAAVQERLELGRIHVALERQVGVRIISDGPGQVDGLGVPDLDVGPGRVEMNVARHGAVPAENRFEKNPLGRPALVGGDDVGEAEDVADRLLKPEKAPGSGVGLVARHDSGPLPVAHGRGSGVGQKIDEDFFGGQVEDVESGGPDKLVALAPRGPAQRLDHLDPERLDGRGNLTHKRPPMIME